MKSQPVLTEAEWALVVELLEQERRELPAEIHRTSTWEFRDELHRRAQMVDALLERLRPLAAASER